MTPSRRAFVTEAAILTATGGTILTLNAMAAEGENVPQESPNAFYKVYPIGKVEKNDTSARIRIFDEYSEGLVGLDQWSHVNVLYWFDQNDVAEKRRILQVHPRGDRQNPLTGVFACRTPVRPNLIALTVCKILGIEKNVLTVDQIDAFDATPVIDLKPFIPLDAPTKDVRVPHWVKR